MAPSAEVSSEEILFLLKEFLLIRTGYKVYQDRKEGKAITEQFTSAAAINSIFSRRTFNLNPTLRQDPKFSEDTILKVKSRQNQNNPHPSTPIRFSRTAWVQVIMVSWQTCNDIQREGESTQKVGHSVRSEHPWEEPLMVDIRTVSRPGHASQNGNGNRSSTQGVTLALNTPQGCCWASFERPVFLTVFSEALEGYVCPTASLSVNPCLEPTPRLTDAPINHHGQRGTDAISHLIDSSGKKNSLLEWETVSLRLHWFWFTSIYFHQLQTGIWGLEGGHPCVCVCVCLFRDSQGWEGLCFFFFFLATYI